MWLSFHICCTFNMLTYSFPNRFAGLTWVGVCEFKVFDFCKHNSAHMGWKFLGEHNITSASYFVFITWHRSAKMKKIERPLHNNIMWMWSLLIACNVFVFLKQIIKRELMCTIFSKAFPWISTFRPNSPLPWPVKTVW